MSLASLDGKTRLNGLAVGIISCGRSQNRDVTGKLHNRDPKWYRESPRPSLRVFILKELNAAKGAVWPARPVSIY